METVSEWKKVSTGEGDEEREMETHRQTLKNAAQIPDITDAAAEASNDPPNEPLYSMFLDIVREGASKEDQRINRQFRSGDSPRKQPRKEDTETEHIARKDEQSSREPISEPGFCKQTRCKLAKEEGTKKDVPRERTTNVTHGLGALGRKLRTEYKTQLESVQERSSRIDLGARTKSQSNEREKREVRDQGRTGNKPSSKSRAPALTSARGQEPDGRREAKVEKGAKKYQTLTQKSAAEAKRTKTYLSKIKRPIRAAIAIPATPRARQAKQRGYACAGCHERTHLVRECGRMRKMEDAQRVRRNEAGWYQLADGREITRRSGESLCNAVDRQERKGKINQTKLKTLMPKRLPVDDSLQGRATLDRKHVDRKLEHNRSENARNTQAKQEQEEQGELRDSEAKHKLSTHRIHSPSPPSLSRPLPPIPISLRDPPPIELQTLLSHFSMQAIENFSKTRVALVLDLSQVYAAHLPSGMIRPNGMMYLFTPTYPNLELAKNEASSTHNYSITHATDGTWIIRPRGRTYKMHPHELFLPNGVTSAVGFRNILSEVSYYPNDPSHEGLHFQVPSLTRLVVFDQEVMNSARLHPHGWSEARIVSAAYVSPHSRTYVQLSNSTTTRSEEGCAPSLIGRPTPDNDDDETNGEGVLMEDEDDVPEDSEDDESSEEGMDLETDDEYEVRLHGDCCDLLDGTSIAHESQHNPSPVGMRYRRTMSVDRACSVTNLEREIFGSQSDTSSESHSPIEDSRGRRKTSPGSEGRARSTPPLPHNTVSFVLVPPPVLPHLQTDFTHLTDTRVIYDYLAKDHDIQLDVSRAEADDGEVTDDDLPPLIPVASTPPTLEEVNTFLTAVSLMHGANTEYVNEVTHGLRDPTTYGSSFAQETEQASGMTENLSHSNIEVEPPHVVRRREREYLLRELCEDVTDSSEQSNSDNSDDDAPMALELPYTHDLDITAVPYPLITASSPPPSPLGSYVSDNVPTPGCDSMFVQTCTPLDTHCECRTRE